MSVPHKTLTFQTCIRCMTSVPLSERSDGVYFCQEHDVHRELWMWGVQHNFPAVNVGMHDVPALTLRCGTLVHHAPAIRLARYSIGEGRAAWLLNIGLADEERIAELVCYVMAQEEKDEEQIA